MFTSYQPPTAATLHPAAGAVVSPGDQGPPPHALSRRRWDPQGLPSDSPELLLQTQLSRSSSSSSVARAAAQASCPDVAAQPRSQRALNLLSLLEASTRRLARRCVGPSPLRQGWSCPRLSPSRCCADVPIWLLRCRSWGWVFAFSQQGVQREPSCGESPGLVKLIKKNVIPRLCRRMGNSPALRGLWG